MTTFRWKTKIQGPVAIIGDLHGQADKLQVVLDRLRERPDFSQRWVLFIGDFVDRGPDTKSVIDMVIEFIADHPATTAIMGNHEFAMCSALGWLPGSEAAGWGERWTKHYNSQSTFTSYGAEVGNLEDLASKIPPKHREFLSSLPWCVEHPQLLFVHAGLDPTMPFNVQLRILHEKDFTLNRPQWLCEKLFVHPDPPPDCPLTVVSGHVKVPSVVVRPRRILVDTTGGEKGDLSCLLMPERHLITSSKSPGGRKGRLGQLTGSKWWKFWG